MIKLLVIDDSALMRRLLGRTFAAEGDFEVAYARNGEEALQQLHAFQPQVITLDVQMPGMDGLACLDRIMLERPTPVVMVSALTAEGAEETLLALELGAVDVVTKPAGPLSLELPSLAPSLVETVRTAARARIRPTHRLAERLRARAGGARPSPASSSGKRKARPPKAAARLAPSGSEGLVLIGCSTGGPPALDVVLSTLPADFRWPVLVAQHMPASFTGPLARRLDGICALSVVEVTAPMRLEPGRVYVGRGEADLIVTRRPAGLTALAAPASPEHRWHPSVDRLVDSALAAAPQVRLVGVLLTGMGNDGAAAMTRLSQAGGRTIAQSDASSVVWGMPGELVRLGGAGQVSDLEDIPAAILAEAAAA